MLCTISTGVVSYTTDDQPVEMVQSIQFIGTQETAASATGEPAASGAVAATNVSGEQLLPGVSNYFIGNDPSQWYTNVANYARVRVHNLYAGINAVYRNSQGRVEFDLEVAPNANPAAVT